MDDFEVDESGSEESVGTAPASARVGVATERDAALLGTEVERTRCELVPPRVRVADGDPAAAAAPLDAEPEEDPLGSLLPVELLLDELVELLLDELGEAGRLGGSTPRVVADAVGVADGVGVAEPCVCELDEPEEDDPEEPEELGVPLEDELDEPEEGEPELGEPEEGDAVDTGDWPSDGRGVGDPEGPAVPLGLGARGPDVRAVTTADGEEGNPTATVVGAMVMTLGRSVGVAAGALGDTGVPAARLTARWSSDWSFAARAGSGCCPVSAFMALTALRTLA